MNKLLFQLIIFLFIKLGCYSAYANFGESCVNLPAVDNSGYLMNDTAYGYLVKNIDMTTNIQNGCTQDGNILRFCIRNNITNPVCNPVAMNLGQVKKLQDISSNPDIGANPLLADIQVSVEVVDSNLCLMMSTSRGKMPVICRAYNSIIVNPGVEASVCQNLGASCYDGSSKSQSLLSFSGVTINCVRQTLDKVFYTGNGCSQTEDSIYFTLLSPFPYFQEAMKKSIGAALILYVMFYGFKVVLNNEYVHLNKVATFILKFLFVVYFSVGLGNYYDQTGKSVNHNGMTETVLPMLLQLTSDFTEIVFLSGGSQGLCNYDPSKYEAGYGFYRVWDAIDCRVGYYFGMQLLYNLGSAGFLSGGSTSAYGNIASSAADFGPPGTEGIEALKKPGMLTFFVVMFGFFMAGNIIIVLCGMIFGIIFLSVIFYFLNVYLVSMVTLYVMVYISPIFVPMLLFERTKGYFDAWTKIIVSCALQPAVVGGFVALLLTMYDSIFFGNCEYLRHDYNSSGINFSTFELREPASEPEKCINSTGYKLIKFYLGQGWEKKTLLIFEITTLSDFLDLALSMVYMVVYVFIFYFAIQSVNEFISDLTSGPNMSSVVVSPTALMDKAKQAVEFIKAAASKDPQAAKAAVSQEKKSETGGDKEGETSDKVSTGGSSKEEASDTISAPGGSK
ncbi:MAG: type IV secretion system protein [Rickettsiaceae bacterium]|nr:type IV secretion system protein [Rickettsiaceae bacterium]